MGKLTKLSMGAGSLVLGAGVAWRYAVRRRSLPCPAWLGWTLENPLVETVAGAATLLDRADVGPGMRVLDAGCGPGRITFAAAARVGETGGVVALDIQPEMLATIEVRIRERGVTNVQPLRAGLGDGHLEEGGYDRVLLAMVLGEVTDRRAAMAELAAAVKPGGLLSVTEVLPDPHYQSRRTVERLATEAGLTLAKYYRGMLAYTVNFSKPASG